MKVNCKHATPLHIVSDAIRECYDSHHLSDTETICDAHSRGVKIVLGSKDRELIDRVGNLNKHQSVLEHLVFNFRIEGVSRMILQEFARHRIASLSVKSTRFTLQELTKEEPFTDINTCIERARKFLVMPDGDLFKLRENVVWFWQKQVDELDSLREAIQRGIKRDISKYLVPDSYKTNISWTINARSLQNFLMLRTSPHAHFEIRELASKTFDAIPEEYRYLLERCVYNPDSTGLEEVSGADLLKEFKKRYNGSVLEELEIGKILDVIPNIKLQQYLAGGK